MADSRALTQAEIDALLNQVAETGAGDAVDGPPGSGGAPASQDRPIVRLIKAYDFRRPDKFSKEQWHTLQSMHDTFARQVGAAFSSRLRTLVTIRLSSIEQGLYEEWQAQVPGQTVCYVLSMAPLDGNIVLEFSTDIAAEVIDRLLGGNGILVSRDRDFGEIEVTLLRSFARGFSNALEDMWSAVTPIQVELNDMAMDAGLVQVAGANDVVVTALFEVGIGNQLGAMSICIPYTVIEPVASSLSAQVWRQSGAAKHDPRVREVVEALVRRTSIDVVVEAGTTTVPVATLLAMTEGDTLILDRRVGDSLVVQIDGRPRFLCRPGVIGNQTVVRITEAIASRESAVPDSPALTIGGAKFADRVAEREVMPALPALTAPALDEYEEAASA